MFWPFGFQRFAHDCHHNNDVDDDDNDVDVVTVVVRSFVRSVVCCVADFLPINLLSNHVFMSKTKAKTNIKSKKKTRTTDANIGQI